MNPEIERILREMCKYVGASYDSIDWQDDERPYYMLYTWSRAAELCFQGWLEGELKKRKVCRALTGVSYSNARMRKNAAMQFVAWHGWKTEQTALDNG